MPWTLLKDRNDWNRHCTEVTAAHDMTAAQVAWGSGPVEYPCLAATLVTPPVPGGLSKLVTAYVYKADAATLLNAAGVTAETPAINNPSQSQFNRWVSAQLLAMLYFMIETRICKQEQFEDKLLEMLENVDAWKREKTDELRDRLGRAAVRSLEGYEPPGQ